MGVLKIYWQKSTLLLQILIPSESHKMEFALYHYDEAKYIIDLHIKR